MSDTVIAVENISKRYLLGHHHRSGEYASTLREAIAQGVNNFTRRAVDILHGREIIYGNKVEEFWAVKNVTFEVKQGEVLGIIGRNGAGKSTMLKILSRITEPTRGRVLIRGRLATLLEVGTGFHPELTGRENIYLNGAILGMSRREIRHKFDEIVEFSDIENFLDTPVKKYSSGMYIRLAFAVAAHLEPEVLIVDEILAVGDAAFQRKCLGKMENVARQGRTVLFVSHNLSAITALCSRVLWLDAGELVSQGHPLQIVNSYLGALDSASSVSLDKRTDRSGDASVMLTSIQISNADGSKAIRSGSRLKITIGYRGSGAIKRPRFLIGIYANEVGLFGLDSEAVGGLDELASAEGAVACTTEPINLTAGRCHLNLAVMNGGILSDHVERAAFFDVEAEDVYGTGKLPGRDWAFCLMKHTWTSL